MTRINVWDQDTLDMLAKAGIAPVVIERVRATMQENAELYEIAAEPKVAWILGLKDAEELHEYLHRNRPGGYEAMHAELRNAIARAKP